VSTAPYRVLVTGSRNWDDPHTVRRALEAALGQALPDRPMVVVHGDCPTGADIMAKVWAITWCTDECGTVTEEPHPAAWHINGRRAGFIRNAHMVNLGADLCLAFIKDGSRGASHTARLAEEAGIVTRRWTA
jgi:hypothetical protein